MPLERLRTTVAGVGAVETHALSNPSPALAPLLAPQPARAEPTQPTWGA